MKSRRAGAYAGTYRDARGSFEDRNYNSRDYSDRNYDGKSYDSGIYDNVITGRFGAGSAPSVAIRDSAVIRDGSSPAWDSRRTSSSRSQRQRQRRLRRLLIAVLAVAAFCIGFFSHALFHAYADVEEGVAGERYYTSVQLKQGDNLWDIAREYADGSGYTVPQYVDELKKINCLQDGETIHSGEYITVVYRAE